MQLPSLADFQSAHRRILSHIGPTPCLPSFALSNEERTTWMKLECLQPIGAFKIRGALNSVMQLSDAARERGVVCASTGNHARALAYAGQRLQVPVTVCMSSLVPQTKVDAVKALGAHVEIIGQSQDEAQVRVNQLVSEHGLTDIPPFDALDTLTGQGTLMLEIESVMHRLPDTVIVPLSGGGLIAGVAACAKALDPSIRIIGVSMQRGAAMAESLKAGHPVTVTEEPTLADSLGGGIGMNNRYTFEITRALVDEVICIPERTIAQAMRDCYHNERLIQEGAGATPYAIATEHPALMGSCTLLILSGKNVDLSQFSAVLAGQLPYGDDP